MNMGQYFRAITQNEGGRVSSNHKVSFAEKFADKYATDIYGFMELLERENIAAKGSYADSWEYILHGTHSLRRLTNLNIFLNTYLSDIYEEKP